MSQNRRLLFDQIFRTTKKILQSEVWKSLTDRLADGAGPKEFIARLADMCSEPEVSPFASDLAAIELALHKSQQSSFSSDDNINAAAKFSLNPTLNLVPVSWKNLSCFLNGSDSNDFQPVKESGFVVTYKHPVTGETVAEDASDELLLSLKIVAEELDLREAAKISGTTVWPLYCALRNSAAKGALVESPSRIRRTADYPRGKNIEQNFFSSDVFTLQWHITQACDLHCRHCYDRSDRENVSITDAVRILDELYDFCAAKNVTGQVSFSGGNPFMHSAFNEIYREASFRGFALAILGNPVSAEALEDIVSIEKPVFYQVSLEGLAEYNNYVRGSGHFDRILEFLDLLKRFDIYSMVMLTLSRANMDQVIPLARILEHRADLFTFNRLSVVGEAQNMLLPDKEDYKKFLADFVKETETNKALTCKDNLINILLAENGRELFGGCAGYGCSAAFNFLSLLSDGEVHACRKLPSKIGDISTQSLINIYDSEAAERYRMGPAECSDCDIRPVCGGCLAVANSFGLDIFSQKDPMCFIKRNMPVE